MQQVPNPRHPSGKSGHKVREVLSVQEFRLNRPGTQNGQSATGSGPQTETSQTSRGTMQPTQLSSPNMNLGSSTRPVPPRPPAASGHLPPSASPRQSSQAAAAAVPMMPSEIPGAMDPYTRPGASYQSTVELTGRDQSADPVHSGVNTEPDPDPAPAPGARLAQPRHSVGGVGPNATRTQSEAPSSLASHIQNDPHAWVDNRPPAERDPDTDTVDLPSQGQFYGFGPLQISPLRGRTIAKFHRAYLENKLRFTVEAISSTLNGVSAFDLTPADFYYLMYWHKSRNIGSTNTMIEGRCGDADHQKKVISGEKHKDTLKIEQLLTRTSLEVTDLPIIDVRSFQERLPGYTLGVETMRDVVESSEIVTQMVEEATTDDGIDLFKDESTEFIWLAERAGFIVPHGEDQSFLAKIRVIADMSPEDINVLDQYIAAVTAYGVSEFANIRCKECGALTKVKLSFDALSFLPGN